MSFLDIKVSIKVQYPVKETSVFVDEHNIYVKHKDIIKFPFGCYLTISAFTEIELRLI